MPDLLIANRHGPLTRESEIDCDDVIKMSRVRMEPFKLTSDEVSSPPSDNQD